MIFHCLASVCTIHSVWNPLLSCPFTWGFPPLHQESANEGWVPLSLASWSHSLRSCFTSCGLLSVSLIGQAFHEAKGHLLFLFILYLSFFTCFWCGLFLKSLLNLLQHRFCFMFWIFFSFFFTTRQVKVPQHLPCRILHVPPFLNTATSPLSSFPCLIMLSTFSHPT